jgi:hypothetical protein
MDEEICFATPTVELQPYASEYEGYMGNWGNTMDRWYRRAAVVLWPRERDFLVRAEASPRAALGALAKRLRHGDIDEARRLAGTMLPVWKDVVAGEPGRKLFHRVLRLAEGLDDPDLATALLEPLSLGSLTSREAAAFGALVERYGEPWVDAILSQWSASERRWLSGEPDPLDWTRRLPSLCRALIGADEGAGRSAACLLLWDRW